MPQGPPGIPSSSPGIAKPEKLKYARSRKNTEKLVEFDGDAWSYCYWRGRMMDHLADEWQRWRQIIHECEKCETPITWERVQAIWIDNSFNGTELALELLSFISRWIGKKLYERRNKWCRH